MAEFSAREQLMLELINRSRMNPGAEAARFGIDLNEGGPSPAISTAPRQVLAGSDELGKAADKHAKWMTFNGLWHNEGTGSAYFYGEQPDDRIERAGYTDWRIWGENIGYVSGGSLDQTQAIFTLHRDFFVDSGTFGRGHRANLMNAEFSEIGIGNKVVTGSFGSTSSYVTQDFAAAKDGVRFITGVVYDDTVAKDDFFTVGEQTKGRAVNAGIATDTTGSGGGYELGFAKAGSKLVTFDLVGEDLKVKVTLGATNVKVDALNGNEIWTNASSLVSKSAAITELHALGIEGIKLRGSAGNDAIYGNQGANALDGAGGNDTIFGGNGRDTLKGGEGDDRFDFRKVSNSPTKAPDVIVGFDTAGDDVIKLKDVFLGTLLYRGIDAIEDAGELSIAAKGGDVIVSINVDRDLDPEMVIVLKDTSIASIGADDFIL